jgi:hypothetical protein
MTNTPARFHFQGTSGGLPQAQQHTTARNTGSAASVFPPQASEMKEK